MHPIISIACSMGKEIWSLGGKFLSTLLGLVALLWGQRAWYFSSSQGNDNNDGRTPQTALRSLQKLQELLWGGSIRGQRLQRGDTIAFLRGDTFRVIRVERGALQYGLYLNSSVFRQAGAPIVITAYGSSSAPLPLFTGTWRLSDSARAIISSGNLIKVAKPFGGQDSLVALRVFWRGRPLKPARFPNDSMLIVLSSHTRSNTDPDTLICTGLESVSSSFVEGAWVWASGQADYSWGCSKVKELRGNQLLTLSWGWISPLRGARLYLEGKPTFIDQPGEWAYDEAGDTLYLFPPQFPFNPAEYEVMVTRVRSTDRDVADSKALLLTVNYDTLPPNPVQGVHIQNLHFFAVGEAIRTAGVAEVTISRNLFTHSYLPIWNFLADRLYIRENQFFDNEIDCIRVYGRTEAGRQGNPRAMTRRVYIEHNLIKRTGLHPRWSWQTFRVDSARFVQEDYSISIGYNIDSVIVRYNRIDSVSQGGIGGNCFSDAQTDWNSSYAGTIPFIVEKNYITNFCMDFSDCGGIKFSSFMKNGIVRDNILIKGANRDKSHIAIPSRPFAIGLYADVEPQDLIWVGNTVIGASLCCHNFHGEDDSLPGPIRNIRVSQNTFYNCQRLGVDVVPAKGGAERCEVTGNTFFLGMHGGCAVNFYDAGGNNRRDTFEVVRDNQYGLPTYAPPYYYRTESDGSIATYGFRALRERTPYERSPLSRWLDWVRYKEWQNVQVQQSFVSNPQLDPSQSLPIWAFGRARMQRVTSSPLGGAAYLIWYPDTAQAGVWSGVGMRSSEPLYTAILDSAKVYRWKLCWAANRSRDFEASTSWAKFIHPNTGDILYTIDLFALPIFRPYAAETLWIRYQPRFKQFDTRFEIGLERGDSVWISYWDVEEINPNSVPSLTEIYPIFVNPSDTVARFPLPSGWLYLALDSTLVWGQVSVQPWKSRILVRVRYDSALTGAEGFVPVRSWALVYPNPTPDEVKVLLPESAKYALLNLYGQVLAEGSWDFEGKLSLQSLPSGVYLLQLSYQGGYGEVLRLIRE
ncbi:MAG: T9SS type A sorting domain-containing protein [Bacteroidia bacterium]|nr:T9SS type A sorting domain-containing protein [Bacteroidia bacterium]